MRRGVLQNPARLVEIETTIFMLTLVFIDTLIAEISEISVRKQF